MLTFLLSLGQEFGEIGLNDEFYYRSVGQDRRLTRRILENATVVSPDFHTQRTESGKTPAETYYEKTYLTANTSHPLIECDGNYYVIESVAMYLV